MAASIEQTKLAIDQAAQSSGFKCVPVSWEDAQRGVSFGGGLSTVGPNISDVRLYEKSGKLLYTLRSQNWNERVGYISTKDVAVVVGNHIAEGDTPKAITLKKFLQSASEYCGYVGVKTKTLDHPSLDDVCSIRFQTVFLPIADANQHVEFCTEVYNYNTQVDNDPRNMTLLVTPQGTSVQQDGKGPQKIFTHAVDGQGRVHRYWLEAEKSRHQVGGSQKETKEEAEEAAARGKANAIRIGTRAMETRFNVQLLVQIPLMQSPKPPPPGYFSGLFGAGAPQMQQAQAQTFGCPPPSMQQAPAEAFGCPPPCAAPIANIGKFSNAPQSFANFSPMAKIQADSTGTSNAARVSRGSEHSIYDGVANKHPAREEKQHCTITVTMYYTVAGGVPSVDDVKAAIADLNLLYQSCPSDKPLSQCSEITAPPPLNPYWPPAPPPLPDLGPNFPPVGPCFVVRDPQGHQLSLQPYLKAVCDECHNSVDGVACVAYGCRTCDYDLCKPCYQKKFPTCQKGHLLTLVQHHAQRKWFCDYCHGNGTGNTTQEGSWYCAACDYDLCVNCRPKHFQSPQPPFPQPPQPLPFPQPPSIVPKSFPPPFVTTPCSPVNRCHQNHPLVLFAHNTSWLCNHCSRIYSAYQTSQLQACRCEMCNFNLCPTCANPGVKSSNSLPVPPNSIFQPAPSA